MDSRPSPLHPDATAPHAAGRDDSHAERHLLALLGMSHLNDDPVLPIDLTERECDDLLAELDNLRDLYDSGPMSRWDIQHYPPMVTIDIPRLAS